jgi:transcriptional regulator with GAF, ATPase, and Fis domain
MRPAIARPGPSSPVEFEPEILLASGPIVFEDLERRLLREALRLSAGNLAEAAKSVGLSYKTMRYRARKFGLHGGDKA